MVINLLIKNTFFGVYSLLDLLGKKNPNKTKTTLIAKLQNPVLINILNYCLSL